MGLLLWQWGLVGFAAVCLYLTYIVGAGLAWKRGGKRYHEVALVIGSVSGVRAAQRPLSGVGCSDQPTLHCTSVRPGVW
jgi:hypothetical protein